MTDNHAFRRRAMLATLTCLLTISGCGNADMTRTYPVYRVSSPPALDGRVEGDTAWSTIPFDQVFVTPYIGELESHIPAYKQTSFKLGYDNDNLYVAVVCREPWTRYLAEEPPAERSFERDDGVEIYLSPRAREVTHFIVNAVGPRWNEAENGPLVSSSDWDAATHVTDSSYAVEMRIPFRVLGDTPTDGGIWTGNVIRNTVTIISPEDRQTSWSPVRESFDDPIDFGTLVFHSEGLSHAEVERIEKRLRAKSRVFLRLEEAFLDRDQVREIQLLRDYEARVTKRGRGLVGITKGPPDLVEPPSTPAGEVWRYGLGFPSQVSPTESALFTNIRMEGSGNIDFEIGTDVILFDDIDSIDAERAIPISRFERTSDPELGDLIVRKGPIIAAFVPLGALLDDGSPHPHAGTGFGICWAISHKLDADDKYEYTEYVDRKAVLYQFAYDGEVFRALSEIRIDASTLLPDWNLVGNFVTSGIPDGEDLLYVMIARVDDVAVAGYTRWQHRPDGWRPVSFTPVTGFEVTWSEPSLIRDGDGSLLFSARSYDRAVPVNAFDIAVWQSRDGGTTWQQVIYEKNRRARSPVSINRTVDGTPFIAANTPPLRRTREILSVWPLNDGRTGLEGRITARDAPREFGPAPSGSWWRIDHPTSTVVRLADGEWHSVLSYRIVDNGEVEGNAPPASQTGTYVEEVMSAGQAIPAWRF